jgi:DNA-binding SARP family transcriptional activator
VLSVAVLGPLRVEGPGGRVGVGDRKTREVLTLLALAAPRPVSVPALSAVLWDEPPRSAVKTVQAHVSRARTAVGGAVSGGPAGYALDPARVDLDVAAAGELRRRARVAALSGDDHGAAELLGRARERWRGEPELPSTSAGEAERARWVEERLLLVEDHVAAVVAAGDGRAVLGELEALTAEHPLRERLWALRMEALYRSGRQADALAAYRTVRRVLRDELGVEPGPALRALEAAVLAHALPERPPAARSDRADPLPLTGPRYAESGGAHVAYAVFGAGPVDVLLLNPTFVPVDAYTEDPHLAAAVRGLAAGRRVIALDRRGTGLSDPLSPSLEAWVADAVAVLDACGAGRVHVLANADTALVALPLAAEHPDRVVSVTLVNGYARLTRTEDYPHGEPPSVADTLAEIRATAHRPSVDVLSWIAPSVAADARFRAWWDATGRRGASPGSAAALHRLLVGADVRHVLPRVTAPVLLISRTGCASHDPGHDDYLLTHLPTARVVTYPDPDGPWFLGDTGRVLAEFAAFTRT